MAFWFTHPIVVLLGRTKLMQSGSKLTGLDPDRIGGRSAIDSLAGRSARKRRDDYRERKVDNDASAEDANTDTENAEARS